MISIARDGRRSRYRIHSRGQIGGNDTAFDCQRTLRPLDTPGIINTGYEHPFQPIAMHNHAASSGHWQLNTATQSLLAHRHHAPFGYVGSAAEPNHTSVAVFDGKHRNVAENSRWRLPHFATSLPAIPANAGPIHTLTGFQPKTNSRSLSAFHPPPRVTWQREAAAARIRAFGPACQPRIGGTVICGSHLPWCMYT